MYYSLSAVVDLNFLLKINQPNYIETKNDNVADNQLA